MHRLTGLSWSRNWGGGGAAWEGCRWGRGEDRGAVRLLTALIGWVFHQGAVAGKLGVSRTPEEFQTTHSDLPVIKKYFINNMFSIKLPSICTFEISNNKI